VSAPIQRKEYKDFSLEMHRRAGVVGRPFKATIELTYGCNLYCVHCYTDCYNRPDLIKERELSTEEIGRILDQLHDEGILWLCFTGGEIFMRPDFFDLYRHAESLGFIITLFTNATLVTPRIADFLARHRPFSIETSLHGTHETFDEITQVRGSFERFAQGIRLLLERDLPVTVKTKAMTLNRGKLDNVEAFVEGLGLEFRVSTEIFPRLDGDLSPARYRLAPEEIVDLELSTEELDDSEACPTVGNPDSDLGPPPDDRLYRCGCGTTSVHINAWGELGACTWVSAPRVDLREHSVATAIAEVFPRVLGARYQTDSPCRGCQIYSLCDKMPAIAAPEAGDREGPPEHFCSVAHVRARRMGVIAERGRIVGRAPRTF